MFSHQYLTVYQKALTCVASLLEHSRSWDKRHASISASNCSGALHRCCTLWPTAEHARPEISNRGSVRRSGAAPAPRGIPVVTIRRASRIVQAAVLAQVESTKGAYENQIKRRTEEAKVGWIFLWLLGIPIPILVILFLLRGCT